MIILLSPAKTFSKSKIVSNHVPYFQNEALSLIKLLQKKKIPELMESMKISENLANQVYKYHLDYGQYLLSAIHTYDGQAFKGFDIWSAHEDLTLKINNQLYILSGLYGLLKPLDAISYYRLDIKDSIIKDLYPFWKKKIAKYFAQYHKNELIINLASSEYRKLLPKDINLITIDFLQIKNGKYQSISMLVKKMRGMMARYLIEHDISIIENMKLIHLDGYQYDSSKSSEKNLIFSKEV